MTTIRVAVWGLGHHAVSNILPAVAGTDGLALYGVCSRNATVVSDCRRAWQCRGWTDPGAMLGDTAVDAVFVATPIGLHAAHGRQVLAAGRHLWCEKPLTSVLDETLELVGAAAKSRLSLCEGFMYLHHPQFARLSRFVSDGTLGEIRSVVCRFGIPALERATFRDDPGLGGGALLDVGSYPVSAIHALFPGERVEVVHAGVERRSGSAVDTDGQALVGLSGGARAWLEWRTGSAYRNEIDVWGARGSVSTQRIFSKPADYVPEFRVRDLRGAETVEAGAPGNHFVRMLGVFRETISDGATATAERDRIVARAETMRAIGEKARAAQTR
jgi:predicted dehydrogenase